MSLEHKNYLKKIKINNFLIKLTQLLIIIFLIFLWQFLADKEMINTFVASSPKAILKTIINLYHDGSLFHHIFITFYEVFISFILGTIIGIFIATILWRFNFLSKVLDPYLTILNSLPKVSLGPIIIILAGASTKSIIIMALFISVIVTIINVMQAFQETDPNKIRLLKSFKAKPSQIFFKLILPSNYANLISICKINIGLVFIGVIMGEFLVSKAGIGYLIMYGSQVFNLNLVMSGIILLAIMASLMYYLIVFIEKKLLHLK
jgi:NitT/TauT family transport system permease protein